MPSYPNAHVKVEDKDRAKRELTLLCTFDKINNPLNSVVIVAWYDYERKCGISHIMTNEGDELDDHLALELRDVLLHYCRIIFNLDRFLEDYLDNSDCEEGEIFRSPYPIDWDTIAKEDRIRREEEGL